MPQQKSHTFRLGPLGEGPRGRAPATLVTAGPHSPGVTPASPPLPGLVRRTNARCQFADAVLEVTAFGRGQAEPQRGLVGGHRVGFAARLAEQLGPGDVELRPAIHLRMRARGVEDRQAGRRAFRHGHRDRTVRLRDGTGLIADELAVQGGNLPPVGCAGRGGARVAGRDGGVQLVGPGAAGAQRGLEQPFTLRDLGPVPFGPVLVRQHDQLAVRAGPRAAPGVGEQQQGEQTGHLGLAGEQGRQRPGQPDRLVTQLAADQVRSSGRHVPPRENEVDHPQHGVQPFCQPRRPRHAQRDAGLADLALGPYQALRHRRLRHEERRRDVGRAQAADGPQGQPDTGRGIERGVTAGRKSGRADRRPGPAAAGRAPAKVTHRQRFPCRPAAVHGAPGPPPCAGPRRSATPSD